MKKAVLIMTLLTLTRFAFAADNFVRGYQFDGATNLHTGADLEDLVTQAKFTAAAFTGGTNGLFDNVTIGDNGTQQAEVKDGSITTAKIADNAVTGAKILDGTIETNDISASTISYLSSLNTLNSYMSGFHCRWGSASAITIVQGQALVNGVLMARSSSGNYTITSIPANATNIMYLYIDYSESVSTPSNPGWTNTTTAPAYNSTLKGWYNGNDRVIAAFVVTNGVIPYFTTPTIYNGDDPRVINTYVQVAGDNMNPDGNWNVPSNSTTAVTTEIATLVPVNAGRVYLGCTWDATAGNEGYGVIAQKEIADIIGNVADISVAFRNQNASGGYRAAGGYVGDFFIVDWFVTGPSRNFRIAGEDDDQDEMGVYVLGWEIDR